MSPCRRLDPDRWPELAAFVWQHNRRSDGRARCLHAEHGQSEADQAAELRGLPADEAVFIVAGPDQAPDGWIGAEFDPAAGRAWVRGPLLRPMPAEEAQALRQQLIGALLASMPATPRFDAFPQADETPLLEAYAACDFQPLMRHHVMCRTLPPNHDAVRPSVRAVRSGDPALAAVLPLHERLFPRSYLPGDALASGLDDGARCLFVVDDETGPAGYVVVQQPPHEQEGYVDYLGVDERARGRGLGRALLDAAVHWALRERGLPSISLTVRQDRAPALGLYRAAAFEEIEAGCQMMFERSGATVG